MNFISTVPMMATPISSEVNLFEKFSLEVLLIALGIYLLFLFVFYIVYAIALHRIAKFENFKYGWFAWIPILNSFVIPMMVKDDAPEPIKGDKFVFVFLGTYLVTLVLSEVIPFIFIFLAILQHYSFYLLAKRYSENAMIHLIVSVVTFSMSMIVSLFMFKEKVNQEEINQKDLI